MSAEPVQVVTFEKLSDEKLKEEWDMFEKIIYSNLEHILDKRPTYPVTKFAKA